MFAVSVCSACAGLLEALIDVCVTVQADEPLGKFMDFCTYGHMIDNVVLIVTGTLHERDVHVRPLFLSQTQTSRPPSGVQLMMLMSNPKITCPDHITHQ